MAGPNKWPKIKRLKAVLDPRRGRVFSRFTKEIAVAARLGTGDCVRLDDGFAVTTRPQKLYAVVESLRRAAFETTLAKLGCDPSTLVEVDEATARQVNDHCSELEKLEDLLAVHSNHG